MAELFEKDVRTINEHLVNIFDETGAKGWLTCAGVSSARAKGPSACCMCRLTSAGWSSRGERAAADSSGTLTLNGGVIFSTR